MCECCNYSTDIKVNFNKHINSKKHKLVESKSVVSPGKSKVSPEPVQSIPIVNSLENENFSCKYCGQKYKHKQSVTKHIKYSCTKNKTEDLTELVRLLNLQLEQQKNEFETKLQTQTKQIEKLMEKLEINNTYNTNSNNTINNVNINLLNYKDTDTSHLTYNDYNKCLKQASRCVLKLIEKVHFNPDKPENMNIYISNLKDKYLMVYESGNWNIKTKKELDYLYEQKEMMLDEWIQEQDKYPELKEKFIQYLHNKDNNETLNMIKDEIKLMMYNKRGLLDN